MRCNVKKKEITIRHHLADAEASLEAALPVLEAAKLALQNLSRNDITEIRSFAKPPKAVQVFSPLAFSFSPSLLSFFSCSRF